MLPSSAYGETLGKAEGKGKKNAFENWLEKKRTRETNRRTKLDRHHEMYVLYSVFVRKKFEKNPNKY